MLHCRDAFTDHCDAVTARRDALRNRRDARNLRCDAFRWRCDACALGVTIGGMRVAALERGLFVAGIGIFPELAPDQCERIYDEISVALLDFMVQRPEAREVLAVTEDGTPDTVELLLPGGGGTS